jgi:hypothetical protein
MLVNGLNITRILIALVLVLLRNSFLYCPCAAHSFSKETRSVKALLLGQSKTSYYKVLLYEHSIYSYKLFFECGIPMPQDAGTPLLSLLQIFILYIISIAMLKNVPPTQGYRKEPSFPH